MKPLFCMTPPVRPRRIWDSECKRFHCKKLLTFILFFQKYREVVQTSWNVQKWRLWIQWYSIRPGEILKIFMGNTLKNVRIWSKKHDQSHEYFHCTACFIATDPHVHYITHVMLCAYHGTARRIIFSTLGCIVTIIHGFQSGMRDPWCAGREDRRPRARGDRSRPRVKLPAEDMPKWKLNLQRHISCISSPPPHVAGGVHQGGSLKVWISTKRIYGGARGTTGYLR